MRTFLYLIRSFRPLNLAITAFTLHLAQYMLLLPVSGLAEHIIPLTHLNFIWLMVSVILIMAGGNVINDYFDRDVDILNQRKFNVTHLLGINKSLWIWGLFSMIGLITGFVPAFTSGAIHLWSVQLGACLLLLIYSSHLKGIPFLGNLTVALLCGLIPALPLIYAKREIGLHFEPAMFLINFLCLFAFMVTLVREMTKDLEDMIGDRFGRHLTLPILFGVGFTRLFINIISILFIFLVVSLILNSFDNDFFSTFYLSFGVLIPYLLLIIALNRRKDKRSFHLISQGFKLILLSGLIYAFVFSKLYL